MMNLLNLLRPRPTRLSKPASMAAPAMPDPQAEAVADEAERVRLEASLVNTRGANGREQVAFYPVNDRTLPFVERGVRCGGIHQEDLLVCDDPFTRRRLQGKAGPSVITSAEMPEHGVRGLYLLEADEQIERWLADLDYSQFHFSVNDREVLRWPTGNESLWKPYRHLRMSFRNSVVPPLHYSNYAYLQHLKTLIRPGMKILDAFAGSGTVGLSLAKECGLHDASLFELNPVAAQTIRENIAANFPASNQIRVYESNLFDAIPAECRYDLITGNPPHNLDPQRRYQHLERVVYVQAHDTEMQIHRDFFRQARGRLTPTGKICLLENGEDTCICMDHLEQLLLEFPEFVIESHDVLPGSQFYQITVRLKL